MKFLDTMTKLKALFDLFKKEPQEPAQSSGKWKKILIAVALILTGILIAVGIVLLIKKLKQRRLQKEAEAELKEFYSTDPDADEYGDELYEDE